MVSGNDFTVSGDFTAGGLTYPTSDGTSGQFIKTDGSGNLSFGTVDTSYRNGEIIEELWSLCDGGTLQGNAATVQNVTANQGTTTTYTDLNGSVVEGYVVPSGTKTVIYTFNFYQGKQDSTSVMHYRLYYKVGSGSWTQVTSGFQNITGEDVGFRQSLIWPFTVNASTADAGTGVLTEATPTLSFKWQVREYSTSYEAKIHSTDWTDGSGTDTFVKPFVGVKAIAGS